MAIALVFAALILLVSLLGMGALLALITKVIAATGISHAAQRWLFVLIGIPFLAPAFAPSFLPVPLPIALVLLFTADFGVLLVQWELIMWSSLITGVLLTLGSRWAVGAANSENEESGRVPRG